MRTIGAWTQGTSTKSYSLFGYYLAMFAVIVYRCPESLSGCARVSLVKALGLRVGDLTAYSLAPIYSNLTSRVFMALRP